MQPYSSEVLQLQVAKVSWLDVAEHAGIWTRISLSLILLKMHYLGKCRTLLTLGAGRNLPDESNSLYLQVSLRRLSSF